MESPAKQNRTWRSMSITLFPDDSLLFPGDSSRHGVFAVNFFFAVSAKKERHDQRPYVETIVPAETDSAILPGTVLCHLRREPADR